MPVVGVPTRQTVLTRDAIRSALRDVAGRIPDTGEINSMLDNVQFSDAEIDTAVFFTVHRYNGVTPVTNLVAEQNNVWTLLMGVVAYLLSSESFRQARNQATVPDGDVPQLGIDDKAPLYSQLAQIATQEFKETARAIKTQMNLESAWGAIGSGYPGTMWRRRR